MFTLTRNIQYYNALSVNNYLLSLIYSQSHLANIVLNSVIDTVSQFIKPSHK